MAYNGRNFPEGVIPELERSDIPLMYRDFPNEVRKLVQDILGNSENQMLVATTYLEDTAELAARIVELSVDRELPAYDHYGGGDPMVETGRTRVIEAGDRFVVATGPDPLAGDLGFAALMERAA